MMPGELIPSHRILIDLKTGAPADNLPSGREQLFYYRHGSTSYLKLPFGQNFSDQFEYMGPMPAQHSIAVNSLVTIKIVGCQSSCQKISAKIEGNCSTDRLCGGSHGTKLQRLNVIPGIHLNRDSDPGHRKTVVPSAVGCVSTVNI
jgi:hypothetical protein